MTAQTDAPPQGAAPAPKAAKRRPGGILSGAWTGALTALLSWAGGVALNSGWHLSMPYLATWAVLLGVVLLSSHLTGVIATAWHAVKIDTAGTVATRAKVAEHITEQWLATAGAAAVKSALAKLKP